MMFFWKTSFAAKAMYYYSLSIIRGRVRRNGRLCQFLYLLILSFGLFFQKIRLADIALSRMEIR